MKRYKAKIINTKPDIKNYGQLFPTFEYRTENGTKTYEPKNSMFLSPFDMSKSYTICEKASGVVFEEKELRKKYLLIVVLIVNIIMLILIPLPIFISFVLLCATPLYISLEVLAGTFKVIYRRIRRRKFQKKMALF